jgi:hypothetical protein
MWRDLNFDEPYFALQQPERFEGLTCMATMAGARQILEYGTVTKLYVINNVQEMMTLMKKRDSQDSVGSEREHKNNCSGDVTFHNSR